MNCPLRCRIQIACSMTVLGVMGLFSSANSSNASSVSEVNLSRKTAEACSSRQISFRTKRAKELPHRPRSGEILREKGGLGAEAFQSAVTIRRRRGGQECPPSEGAPCFLRSPPPPGLRHDPTRNWAGMVHQRRPPRCRCPTTRSLLGRGVARRLGRERCDPGGHPQGVPLRSSGIEVTKKREGYWSCRARTPLIADLISSVNSTPFGGLGTVARIFDKSVRAGRHPQQISGEFFGGHLFVDWGEEGVVFVRSLLLGHGKFIHAR